MKKEKVKERIGIWLDLKEGAYTKKDIVDSFKKITDKLPDNTDIIVKKVDYDFQELYYYRLETETEFSSRLHQEQLEILYEHNYLKREVLDAEAKVSILYRSIKKNKENLNSEDKNVRDRAGRLTSLEQLKLEEAKTNLEICNSTLKAFCKKHGL